MLAIQEEKIKATTYPTYKPSHIDWVGEIPSHWMKMPLKYFSDITLGKMLTPEDKGNFFLKPYLRSQCVQNERVDVSDIKEMWFAERELEIYRLKKNDLLINEGGDVGRTCIWNDELEECYIQNSVNRVSFKDGIPKYFLYHSICHHFTGYYDSSVNRVSIPHLTKEKLQNILFVLPPLPEQQAIVNYLDQKIALIDELIGKKQRKIELLKEQRTAIINHAVTKGLNPNVDLKDSGIEWIGEIPKHWVVKKLKAIGGFQNGISKGAEYFGSGFPFMNYGDVYKNEITPLEVEGKAQSDEKEREQYSILRGDIFFTRTSESKDDIGVSSTCLTTIPNSVFSGFVIRFRFSKESHIPEYSRYHFQTHWKKVFIESQMNIVTRSSLSQQVLGQVPVLIPPLSEQQAIVTYLDEQTVLVGKAISLEAQKIEKLKEYRQSLISAAVTGKICVLPFIEKGKAKTV